MNYYTADLHLSHENVIKHNNRPFKDKLDMNKALIDNYNKVVKAVDTVYFLGDIGYPKNSNQLNEIIENLKKLKGKKVLITGNHDHKLLKKEEFRELFEEITPYKELIDNNRKVVLFHYPIEEWNGYFRDSIHLFGHVHTNEKNILKKKNRYNVGVDVCGYKPVSLDEIINNNK